MDFDKTFRNDRTDLLVLEKKCLFDIKPFLGAENWPTKCGANCHISAFFAPLSH